MITTSMVLPTISEILLQVYGCLGTITQLLFYLLTTEFTSLNYHVLLSHIPIASMGEI